MSEKSWGEHSGNILAEKEGIHTIDCELCGFAHVVPLPDEAEKADFYENAFYDSEKEDYIAKHQEDEAWWRVEHNEKLDQLEALLPDTEQPNRILDIGSGPGLFLKVAKERGWDAEGIEPGLSAWRYSTENLGLTVHRAYVDGSNAQRFGQFDVVHLNNVLEHVVHAGDFVSHIHRMVKSSGFVSISVPNDFNPLQAVAAKQLEHEPWWVVPLHHINYFNRSSLEALLRQHGFETCYTTGSFPLELFLLMGVDYISDGGKGSGVHQQRKLFELTMEKHGQTALKRKMYDALASVGVGRLVTVIAQKKE
ncbi:MAG: class I SAM-dependent methyltransferase [Methylococcales bacterium]|jgi:2-polyprenyl-3-methyl-5-hydroxy-6-metoxy-1,4-benzoquinol methylase|nr:class I SAM-dependent methyltransferase [Methylococcales bacterium]MBT7443500.1 class I SAM-dependent methyltransferase [Methylococcales bacterium]